MSERLTRVTIIHKDANKFGDLQPGEMCHVEDSTKPDLWVICCPLCGSLGELRNHHVGTHEDGTLTASPSLVCNGSIYEPPDSYRPCTAHYFVERNQIRWS